MEMQTTQISKNNFENNGQVGESTLLDFKGNETRGVCNVTLA